MKNRLFWLLMMAWSLGWTGLSIGRQTERRLRLSRLCGDGWIPLCREQTERKRHVYLRGLEKLGLADDTGLSDELFVAVMEAEKKYGLDYRLLTSVAVTESALDREALSNKGARGMLQILPETAMHLWPAFLRTLDADDPIKNLDPVADAYDLRLSVMLGAYYLARLQDLFGDQGLALASYNAGPARVRRAIKDGEPLVAEAYVRKVRGVFRKFQDGSQKQFKEI